MQRIIYTLSEDLSFWEKVKMFFVYLFQGIDETFSLDFNDYDNLNLSSVGLSNLRSAIIAAFLGIILASILTLFNRHVHGDFIRSLINEDCSTPEKAKNLFDLGYMRNSAVRSALRRGSLYRGVVRCVEQDEYNAAIEKKRGVYNAAAEQSGERAKPFKAPDFEMDFEKAHFYIPEELHYTADTRFDKKGANGWAVLAICIACVVGLWGTLKLLPELLQLADNFVGIFHTTNIN